MDIQYSVIDSRAFGPSNNTARWSQELLVMKEKRKRCSCNQWCLTPSTI